MIVRNKNGDFHKNGLKQHKTIDGIFRIADWSYETKKKIFRIKVCKTSYF